MNDSTLTSFREALQQRLHDNTAGLVVEGAALTSGMLFEGGVLTGPVDRTPRGSVFVATAQRDPSNALMQIVQVRVRGFLPPPQEDRDPEKPTDPSELENLMDALIDIVGAIQNDTSLGVWHTEWDSGQIDDETWGVELFFSMWRDNSFGLGN